MKQDSGISLVEKLTKQDDWSCTCATLSFLSLLETLHLFKEIILNINSRLYTLYVLPGYFVLDYTRVTSPLDPKDPTSNMRYFPRISQNSLKIPPNL